MMPHHAIAKEHYSVLRTQLASQLPDFLQAQRWFGGKARRIVSSEIVDIIPVRSEQSKSLILVVGVRFADAAEEFYLMPVLAVAAAAEAKHQPLLRISDIYGETLVLANALENETFLQNLLDTIRDEAVLPGERGELRGRQNRRFGEVCFEPGLLLKGKLLRGEQSNSSIVYGDRLILKMFRRIEEGMNPDLELSALLTERAHYSHIPALAGYLEYLGADGKRSTQGILQAFVLNQGDAWKYTLKSLEGFYEEAKGALRDGIIAEGVRTHTKTAISLYLKSIELLGQRTAELHLALASDVNDPDFQPEPFSTEFQKSFEASLLRMSEDIFQLLREKICSLPVVWRSKAQALADRQDEIAKRFRAILSVPIRAARIRIHGDFHLGQVLYTGSDFVIIDFEGEPARPLAERRIKRSPLQDVAGMLRSFHYAAFAPLLGAAQGNSVDPNRFVELTPFAVEWHAQVVATFLREYFKSSGTAPYLPQNPAQTQKLLDLHLLQKAIYELGYELNNRPDWVGLPLEGISRLLES